MKLIITGKQIDLGDAFRTYVTDNLTKAVTKYFDQAVDGTIVVRREGSNFHCEIKVHVGTGIDEVAHGEAAEIHAAADAAIEHLEKQLRRDKRKLRNHHTGPLPRVDGVS